MTSAAPAAPQGVTPERLPELTAAERLKLSHRTDREMARRGGYGSLVYAAVATLLIAQAWSEGLDPLVLYVVGGASIVFGGTRLWLAHTFERRYDLDPQGWVRRWSACTLGLGLAWGLLAGYSISTAGLKWSSLLVILSVRSLVSPAAIGLLGSTASEPTKSRGPAFASSCSPPFTNVVIAMLNCFAVRALPPRFLTWTFISSVSVALSKVAPAAMQQDTANTISMRPGSRSG